MTFQEVVEEFYLPSVRTIRTLRSQGLPTIKLGAARLIDRDDMLAFIESKKEILAKPERPPLPRVHARASDFPRATTTEQALEYLRRCATKPKSDDF